jgi:hypothetical protein
MAQGSGYFICTDPDQEKLGYYKISKTSNIAQTITKLNSARACKDFKLIKFYPINDLKKMEDFVKSALKNKYIANSTEWVKIDQSGLNKLSNTLEALADIVNDV